MDEFFAAEFTPERAIFATRFNLGIGLRKLKRKPVRLIESLEPRQLLTDPSSASAMFGPLNTKAGSFFTTANSAVADSVEATVNGIGTAFGNSLADARLQVRSVTGWLNMAPNGFDPLTMSEFADAFQSTNSDITTVTQAMHHCTEGAAVIHGAPCIPPLVRNGKRNTLGPP